MVYVIVDGEYTVVCSETITTSSKYINKRIDLSAFAGKTVSFAIRHYKQNSARKLFVDLFEVFSCSNALIRGYDFFQDAYLDNCSSIDADGDGFGWDYYKYLNCACSYSYYKVAENYGFALDPDNWLVFTDLNIPFSGLTASFGVSSFSPNYPNEHFAVYVIPGTVESAEDLNAAVNVLPETVTTYDWQEYFADLSAFAGQTVSFAVRHFNCADQFAILFDQLYFWENDSISGTCGDDMQWMINPITGTLRIYGTGEMYNYDRSSNRAPWQEHQEVITSVTVEEGVQKIGNYAFSDCSSISSITLPASVS